VRLSKEIRYSAVLLAALSASCNSPKHDVSASQGAGASVPSAAASAGPLPLGSSELPTTAGALALANLDAEIAGYTSAVAKKPSLDRIASLADDLEGRGQYLGRLKDYEQAATLGDQAVASYPEEGQAYAARGKARAVYHLFSDALGDLDRAQTLGVKEKVTRGTRASILQALGRYPEAFAIRHAASTEKPELTALGNEASLLAEMGDTDKADQLFVAAQYQYRDVSPFPLAWLWLQQGIMWEKRGKLERARTLFEASIARVPGYAHAVAHLAGLVPPARAIELLRGLSQTSDDPEYQAQLAVLLRENGAGPEAEQLLAAARLSYDTLTARHPDGFADHAARFWLGAGADPQKALISANRFATARPNADSLTLLVDAALAAHDDHVACSAAEQVLKTPHVSSTTHLLAARAFDGCGQSGQASREREIASASP
jgi:tetratricopeptide (TPR) repeat protein